MRKIISSLFITILLFSLCACENSNSSKKESVPDIPVTPASDFEYSEHEGEIILNKYLKDDEYISVPEEIDNKKVTTIGIMCFSGKSMREIIIPDTVTKISDNAFWGCGNLRNIYWSDNITEFGTEAFYACRKLLIDNLPKKLEILGSECFMENESITKITIPASLTEIGEGSFGSSVVTAKFLGDAPETLGNRPFDETTIIYYKKDAKGWDTTPLRDNYTLEAY